MIPVFGKSIVATEMLTKLCTPIKTPNPKQNNFPDSVGALEPVIKHSKTIIKSKIITAAPPIKPSSSPTIVKIKSVWDSEIRFPFLTEVTSLLSNPLPVSPPEPIASKEFSC